MNIFIKELKFSQKAFIFWCIGLFFLVFAGITKFTGISAAGDINQLMAQFPRVVIAVLGMADVDVSTLSGYYTVIGYYVIILADVYALFLGRNAVSRETIDKTYEFLFTKPVSRDTILAMKLWAGAVLLLLYAVLNGLFSYGAVQVLEMGNSINQLIVLYSLVMLLSSLLFFSVGAFFSAAAKSAEKGASYANVVLLVTFVMAVVYDSLQKNIFIKLASPFKYFDANELISSKLDPVFLVISLAITVLLFYFTFVKFRSKDLQ